LVVCCLAVGYALGVVHAKHWGKASGPMTPAKLAQMPDGAVPLAPGPWGNLEALPIFIEMPDEYLPVANIEGADRRWRFIGYTQDQLLALFQSADLTADQRKELTDTTKWQQDGQSIFVTPSKDLILALSPAARKTIYWPMVSTVGTSINYETARFPADRFDSYFIDSGLPDETIALIKKLSFPYAKLIFFSDVQLVLDTLNTPSQKARLLKTIFRKSTLLLRLHITPTSDLNELENYWIKAGWGVDVRPMLESLSRLPQGGRLDVVEIFPPVPSANLYTYTFPSTKPEDLNKDCKWTAMNFFRDTPDNRFTDSKFVVSTLQSDYYPVLSDLRYGDLIVISKPNGDIIHIAVYIAADVVYTKNSPNFYDPFILMKFSDMMDHFSGQIPEDETLHVQFLRNKYY
jgi:hypothetical protein